MLLEGLASVSGLAGAAVIYAVESGIGRQTNAMTITDYEALGAVAGPISTAVLMLQVLLIYLSQRFRWSLLCGRRTITLSSTGWVGIFLFITLASGFARTMLPALYIAEQRETTGQFSQIPDSDGMNNSILSSKPKDIGRGRCHGRPINAFNYFPKYVLGFPSIPRSRHAGKKSLSDCPSGVDNVSHVLGSPHWIGYVGWLYVWSHISKYR